MMMKQINSIFLSYYVIDKLQSVSQLKLQKLLYYIEAWHLVYFENELITDNFEAWVHGPVSTKIYHHFKQTSKLYASMRLKDMSRGKYIEKIKEELDPAQIELINDVLEEYGDKTDYHLEQLTHMELPWQDARGECKHDNPCNNIISKEVIKTYYASKLLHV